MLVRKFDSIDVGEKSLMQLKADLIGIDVDE